MCSRCHRIVLNIQCPANYLIPLLLFLEEKKIFADPFLLLYSSCIPQVNVWDHHSLGPGEEPFSTCSSQHPPEALEKTPSGASQATEGNLEAEAPEVMILQKQSGKAPLLPSVGVLCTFWNSTSNFLRGKPSADF